MTLYNCTLIYDGQADNPWLAFAGTAEARGAVASDAVAGVWTALGGSATNPVALQIGGASFQATLQPLAVPIGITLTPAT